MNTRLALDRRGLAAAIFAYVLWGVFPLYWVLLKTVPPLQIIAHRVVWCCLFVVAFLMLIEAIRVIASMGGPPRPLVEPLVAKTA